MTNKEAIKNLEQIAKQFHKFDFTEAIKVAIEALKDQRPQGEWKLHGMIYYCSVCGHDYEQGGNNFCGNCGADMRGEKP